MILGAGGRKALAEAALLSRQWQRVCFAEDRWPQLQESFGCPVVASSSTLVNVAGKVHAAIAAVGNNAFCEQRLVRLQAFRLPLATVVHPAASVSLDAALGGSAVMALAMVGVVPGSARALSSMPMRSSIMMRCWVRSPIWV